jgi:hypothetical protein
MVGIDIKNLLKSENKANIIVSFFTTVQGTGPKFEDVYVNFYINIENIT